MSLVEIDGVTYRYRTLPEGELALDGVSCAIEQGEMVGITGPTDAGKSTLARLIPGYIPNFYDGRLEGTVTVDGRDTRETTIGDLATTAGMLFENPFDQLTGASTTVLEEVAYGLENLGLPVGEIIDRTKWSLETTGIEDLVTRNPQNLSGGQSQRVALASILAMRPDILVLDEPTSQLDPQGTEEVFRVISELDRSAYTVVVVSQDTERLAPHLDRLLVVEDGAITHDGAPAAVLGDPALDGRVAVPDAVTVGRRLREAGRIDPDEPVPVSLDDAVAELRAAADRPLADGAAAGPDGSAGAGDSDEPDEPSGPDEPTGTAPADGPLIRFADVGFAYDDGIRALRNVSLDMDAGCVCIVGQNGAGKTTFAKHLNGLLEPTDGRVLVDGADTRERRVAQLARTVGLSFQNPNDQLFHDTVEAEVRYGPRNVGHDEEHADELVEAALDDLDLEDVRERNPYDMGQGRRKHVAVASVIAMDSPAVVLDEPTGGQDAAGNALLGDVVADLVDAGTLVIVITHDVEFARRHADRVIALRDGEVLLDGGPREVFGQPDRLAETDVTPPAVTRIGRRLGLDRTVLSVDELFAALGPLDRAE